MSKDGFVHSTALVDSKAQVGRGTKIWVGCQVREKSSIGEDCILSKGVYIDSGVTVGNRVKIQNHVSVYQGVTIQDGVFVGPHVCFTNDKVPRAVQPDGSLKAADDWTVSPTLVKMGASIGANSTIVCGVTIGKWAMIGSGSVVTKNIPDHAIAYGNPARVQGYVCRCGKKIDASQHSSKLCSDCKRLEPE